MPEEVDQSSCDITIAVSAGLGPDEGTVVIAFLGFPITLREDGMPVPGVSLRPGQARNIADRLYQVAREQDARVENAN
jgi:hypothetical protein